MKPTLGRIVHCWDHVGSRWMAGIVNDVHLGGEMFSATVFSHHLEPSSRNFYVDRENQLRLGGWRWPPREEA